MIVSLILHLLLVAGDIWKIGVAYVLSDVCGGFPFVCLIYNAEENVEKLKLVGFPGLPYIPFGVLEGIFLFALEFLLLRKLAPVMLNVRLGSSVKVGMLFIVIWVFAFAAFRFQDRKLQARQEHYHLAHQNELMQEHYEVLREQIQQAEQFRSDIQVMSRQFSFGEKSVSRLEPEQQYIDNKIVNQVFVIKAKVCEKQNIGFYVKAKWVENIDEMDMIILIYNILDNAIESCCRMAGEKILRHRKRTWKRDKKLHGMGMKIMEDICKKYNGIMQYEEQDAEFVLEIRMKEKL